VAAPHLTVVMPGPIARTGGYIYDHRMLEGLQRRGWTADRCILDGNYPFPDASARDKAARAFDAMPSGQIAIVDGLALGALPDTAEQHRQRLRIVAVVHLPLAADPARDRDATATLAGSECRALRATTLVVATGTATLPMLAAYELPKDRIVVIEPGTDRAPLARGSSGSGNPHLELLCVATVNSIKNHVGLLQALAAHKDQAWHLTCAGSLTRDPACVEIVRCAIYDLQLSDRVSLAGELDHTGLDAAYARADLFVLATVQETYAMAVAEALARGLPVVSTRTGAIPALVGVDAGIVVDPHDIDALSRALGSAIGDDSLRAQFAAGARAVRDRLPTWDDAVSRMDAVLGEVARRG
jgi:glycosyltransferase involved in cell wall biosynthesis